MENNPTKSELMKFYTVRNPEPANDDALSAYIGYSSSVESSSNYYNALNATLSKHGDSTETKLANVKQQVENFVSGPHFISTEEQWQMLLPKLKTFKKDILKLKKSEDIVNLIITRISTYFSDGGFDNEINRIVWDNLITYNLIGGKEHLIKYALDAIRAKELIGYALLNPDTYNERVFGFKSKVMLPKSIFPLPSSETVAKETNPITDAEVQLRSFEEAKNAAKSIEMLGEVIQEVKKLEEKYYEEIRNKATKLPPVKVDGEGNPQFPSPSTNEKLGVITEDFLSKLTSSTRDVLSEHKVRPDIDTISFTLNTLEKQKATLSLIVSQKLDLTQTAYVTGESIVLHSPVIEAVQIPPGSISGSITKSGIPIIIDEGASIEGTDSILSIDEPDTPFSDSTGCKVKPLGIADLRRLEQKLICNVPGEIAHIENILKSEAKERLTRRLRRSEEASTVTNDTESQDQRDTITTERFQMDKAVTKVVESKQNFDIGVTISTGFKNKILGQEVKIDAKSGYTSSSGSTTTDAEAIKYAKDVTDTAKRLVIEKTHTEQVSKTIDEFEETNKHLFNNENGDTHVVGIYRWVDKIYEAQVVNYGKRLMFEFMIPDPAAFHRYAMASGKITDAISIVKPLDPIKDIISISGIFPGITSLKSAADITESNYIWWAGLYNAQVEAPPQFEINIGMSKGATAFPNDGFRLGNIATDELVVPDGYEAHEVTCKNVSGYSTVPGTAWIYWNLGKAGAYTTDWGTTGPFAMHKEQGKIPFTITGRTESFTITVNLKCRRTDSSLAAWKLRTFNTIRSAYEALLSEYNIALAEAKARMNEGLMSKNPMLNRAVEQTELRKHAVRLLSHCSFNSSHAMKTDYPGDGVPYPDFNCCEAIEDGKLVQFIESCFEFGLMSYNFYPYFWSRKDQWKTIYRLEDADPIFTQFLQAGYARVLVPIREGFEEVALRYVADGTIWNGEDVPGIDDPYYVSLIEEMQKPVGTVDGEPWEIRIPTSLTILQNEASGINDTGLPCNAEGL